MEILISIFVGMIGILVGAVGVLAGILRSKQNQEDKKLAEEYRVLNEATRQAEQKINEVKKENEEKKQKVHAGNNLDSANAALDILRDN